MGRFHNKCDETQRFPKQDPKALFVELSGYPTGLGQKVVQDLVPPIAGLSKVFRLQRVPDSFHRNRGRVDRVVYPPSSVVVPEVMVEVRFVYTESQFLNMG
jgi:hypothetical protein